MLFRHNFDKYCTSRLQKYTRISYRAYDTFNNNEGNVRPNGLYDGNDDCVHLPSVRHAVSCILLRLVGLLDYRVQSRQRPYWQIDVFSIGVFFYLVAVSTTKNCPTRFAALGMITMLATISDSPLKGFSGDQI